MLLLMMFLSLVVGCWLSVVGCWLLVVGCSMFCRWRLLVTCYLVVARWLVGWLGYWFVGWLVGWRFGFVFGLYCVSLLL